MTTDRIGTARTATAILAVLGATLAMSNESSSVEVIRHDASAPAKGEKANFAGDVTVESRFQQRAPARVGGATVTFQRGARTAWHTHPLGQTLIVTAGTGWVQSDGGPKQKITIGDVVLIPPGVKHWHGATADSAMTHIAIAEALDGKVVQWMEHVTEAQYAAP